MRYGPLLYELVLRDIKIKYRRSALGVLWTVLNPLLMMVILYVVFSKLFRFEIENYAIYILSGQVLFNYYQTATTDAMLAILGNASLIKKIYLPKYILVLAKVLSGGVNLAASFAALVIVILATGGRITPVFFLAAVPLVCLLVFSVGIGLVLAAYTVRFRDIQHLYGVFCMGLFYLTPVIYPSSILPEYMKRIVYFNPLTRMLDPFRCIVMENKIPAAGDMLFCMMTAVIAAAAGGMVFRLRQKKFILEL